MDRMKLIKVVLEGRCQTDDEWHLNALQRYGYTIKAVICVLLGRRYTGREWDWLGNFVTVGMHSFEKFYNYEIGATDATWIDITVGCGWRNWLYYELSDGWL